MIYSDGSRFPELAAVFFRSGPDVVMVELADARPVPRSRRDRMRDLSLAAVVPAVRGDHLRFNMGVQSAPPAEEVERQARWPPASSCGLLKR
jgi:hypothetical protein